MNKHKKNICDICEKETLRKDLGKINGKYYCKKCRRDLRVNHREKTIEDAGIKEELKELKRKQDREYRDPQKNREYGRKAYHKRNPNAIYRNQEMPVIKGSKELNKEPKSNCYISFEDRKNLFKILIQGGMEGKEAKERINELINSQEKLRRNLKLKNKPEEEIKERQQKLLEELWGY